MAENKEASDRAATRRRWVTLGEILAVAAVAISGLTLWDSHQERVRAEQKAQASATREDSEAATLVLRAAPSRDGDRLTLTPLNDTQAIQAQTILFPGALGLTPVETTGDPRIEAAWFDEALKRARKAAGEKEDAPGDQRLPVVVVTHYLADGKPHTARAIHDIGYTLDGRFLRGTAVVLRGMSVVATVPGKAMQPRLDALWRSRHPQTAEKAGK
ncbi:hypothetical protein [Sphingomonas solaris]|uniref:Uncharacterized protein n=1 Tax=Alterirhizorhabdus solaris TaxID=2529389 RepID=A0A558QV56_9SPHN|nr:hypothetical protein [Sphingomonas solaris]TVV70999.1 hypothetical protein FOY91_17805 [Sphingomonas solaris]